MPRLFPRQQPMTSWSLCFRAWHKVGGQSRSGFRSDHRRPSRMTWVHSKLQEPGNSSCPGHQSFSIPVIWYRYRRNKPARPTHEPNLPMFNTHAFVNKPKCWNAAAQCKSVQKSASAVRPDAPPQHQCRPAGAKFLPRIPRSSSPKRPLDQANWQRCQEAKDATNA